MPTNIEIAKEIAEENQKSCTAFQNFVKNEIDKTQADTSTSHIEKNAKLMAKVAKESDAFNKARKNGFFDSINKKSLENQTENSSSLKP